MVHESQYPLRFKKITFTECGAESSSSLELSKIYNLLPNVVELLRESVKKFPSNFFTLELRVSENGRRRVKIRGSFLTIGLTL